MPIKGKIIDLSKKLVKNHGWNDRVLTLACESLNISPVIFIQASSRGLFPNGIFEITESLMKDWEDKLSLDISLTDLQEKPLNQQLFFILQKRLLYEEEYMPRWKDAMQLGLYPNNVSATYSRLFSTMNTIWEIVGDHSNGNAWYIKRNLLGNIFAATEITMVHDATPDRQMTWQALEKQLDNQNFESFTDIFGLWTKYIVNSNPFNRT